MTRVNNPHSPRRSQWDWNDEPEPVGDQPNPQVNVTDPEPAKVLYGPRGEVLRRGGVPQPHRLRAVAMTRREWDLSWPDQDTLDQLHADQADACADWCALHCEEDDPPPFNMADWLPAADEGEGPHGTEPWWLQ